MSLYGNGVPFNYLSLDFDSPFGGVVCSVNSPLFVLFCSFGNQTVFSAQCPVDVCARTRVLS